jgi:hypothetical protein
MNPIRPDAAFDHAARACHAEAVAQVSARTRAQLAQQRHRALAPRPTPARYLAWPLAAAFAAVCVLAIGLPLRHGEWSRPAASPSSSAPTQPVEGSGFDADASGATMLDDPPDFYLWLASDEAATLDQE